MRWLQNLLLAALGRLEPDTAGRLGAWLGELAFVAGLRRACVRDNLRRCLNLRGRQRARVARRSYRSMGATMLQIWSYGHRGPESYVCELASPRYLRGLAAAPHGHVMLTLHSGNWDVAGAAAATVLPGVTVYATRQRDALVDERLNRCREALGMTVQLVRDGDRRGALQLIRGLRDGSRTVGMLADQGPRPSTGVAARFFGRPAWCHHGPVFMARRAGVPLVPAWAVRIGWNRYRFYCGRPLVIDGMSDEQAVQRSMDLLAVMIAAVPGQYFWHHRRFKKAMTAMPPAGIVSHHHLGLDLLRDPSR